MAGLASTWTGSRIWGDGTIGGESRVTGVRMRVTGVGHAGLFIETHAGSVLCDPWVNPAFFGAWFPFPDNSGLDWDWLGQADLLYVSHLHRDHFDAELLTRHVRKDTTVLLPDFPTDELERELAALGFTDFAVSYTHLTLPTIYSV